MFDPLGGRRGKETPDDTCRSRLAADTRDERCDFCGAVATVVVSDDEITLDLACNDCAGDARDLIAETFARVFAKKEGG